MTPNPMATDTHHCIKGEACHCRADPDSERRLRCGNWRRRGRSQSEIDRVARAVQEAGLPDHLNRWLDLTPEKLAEQEARMSKTMGPREQQLRALRAAPPRSEEKPATARALATKIARPAPPVEPKTAAAVAPAEQKPGTPAKQQETTTVKKPTKASKGVAAAKAADKTKKKAAAAKQAKAPAAPKTGAKGKTPAAEKNVPAGLPATNGTGVMPRPGSKNETMFKMVLRPEGATEAAICKELGWARCRVTLGRVCKKAGATLSSDGAGETRVYKATLPGATA